MSKGAGVVEKRIADLFAASHDRALSIDQITGYAFALVGAQPTRAQRLSATRAAHRLIRRTRETRDRAFELVRQGHERVRSALGREKREPTQLPIVEDTEYDGLLERDPAFNKGRKLHDAVERIGVWTRFVRIDQKRLRGEDDFWCATTVKGRLWFHPPDVPVVVWAVTVDHSGVHWFGAEVTKVTERNVMVRYRGELARLDRDKLWRWWAFYRTVRFTSSRTGRIAAALDEVWQHRYGHAAGGVPPSMQMPLEQARLLLGLPHDYSRDDVLAAFRRKAKAAHPDVGGTAEMFRELVEARDRLLTALGTSAPPPKPPDYAPRGATIRYGRGRSSSRRLDSSTPRLARR